MRISILNKQIGQNTSPTGYHAWRLATFLSENGHTVYLVSETDKSSEIQNIEFVRLSKTYQGKNKWRRLWSSFVQSYRMIRKVKKLNTDVQIVMSDPPLLNYWSSVLLKNKGCILWTMDIYPFAFSAAGLLSEDHPLVRYYNHTLYKNRPKLLFSLGSQQSIFLKQYFPAVQMIDCPIGLHEEVSTSRAAPEWYSKGLIHIGYVGTLGEAHDASWIETIADQINPSKIHFILKVNGAQSDRVKQDLKDQKGITILDYIPADQMSWLDVQLVTLKKNWTHISVPSKAISAVQQGSAVLFCGDDQSDTWKYIHPCGWVIDSHDQLIAWLHDINAIELELKKARTVNVTTSLLAHQKKSYQALLASLPDLK